MTPVRPEQRTVGGVLMEPQSSHKAEVGVDWWVNKRPDFAMGYCVCRSPNLCEVVILMLLLLLLSNLTILFVFLTLYLLE